MFLFDKARQYIEIDFRMCGLISLVLLLAESRLDFIVSLNHVAYISFTTL